MGNCLIIQEKKHWDGDLADLTGQCVKVGHEMFELFERCVNNITPILRKQLVSQMC